MFTVDKFGKKMSSTSKKTSRRSHDSLSIKSVESRDGNNNALRKNLSKGSSWSLNLGKSGGFFSSLRLRSSKKCSHSNSLKISELDSDSNKAPFKIKGILKSHSLRELSENEKKEQVQTRSFIQFSPFTQEKSAYQTSKPWIRGVSYAPDCDFCVLDSNNSLVMRYARDARQGKYALETRKKLPSKPRDIAYIQCYLGNSSFSGFVITMETKLLAYMVPKTLDIVQVFQTNGSYSGVKPIPKTNLLVVVNAMTSSIDVINVYGVPMHSYRMPAEINAANGYLAVSLVNNNPIVILSGSSGLVCMNLEWRRDRICDMPLDLILRSVQRYVPHQDDKFRPEGVCSTRDQVFVANYAGNSIIRFKLMTSRKDAGRVTLSRICEHPCLEPIALDVITSSEKTAEIGIGRLKGEPPGYHLLKFVTVSLDLNEGNVNSTKLRQHCHCPSERRGPYKESIARF